MTDVYDSCNITNNGISIKVIRDGVGWRTALGLGDFANQEDYIAAAGNLLDTLLGSDNEVTIAAKARILELLD